MLAWLSYLSISCPHLSLDLRFGFQLFVLSRLEGRGRGGWRGHAPIQHLGLKRLRAELGLYLDVRYESSSK